MYRQDNTLKQRKSFDPSGPLNVAIVAPFSGPDAKIGRALLDAAQLSLHDNQVRNVVIHPVDSEARSGLDNIINTESNIHAVVGPLFAHKAAALHREVSRAGIPVFTFSNDESLLDNSDMYTLGVSVKNQIDAVINQALGNGYNKVFSVTPDNRYGKMVQRHLKASNMDLIAEYEYNSRDSISSFGAILADIRGKMAEGEKYAIAFPEAGRNLPDFARSFNLSFETGVEDVILLGSSQWDNARAQSAVKSLVQNAYFPSVNPGRVSQFQKKYQQNFGSRPHALAALGYDAIIVMSQLANRLKAQSANEVDSSILHGYSFESAVTGPFTLNARGDLQRALVVKAVK